MNNRKVVAALAALLSVTLAYPALASADPPPEDKVRYSPERGLIYEGSRTGVVFKEQYQLGEPSMNLYGYAPLKDNNPDKSGSYCAFEGDTNLNKCIRLEFTDVVLPQNGNITEGRVIVKKGTTFNVLENFGGELYSSVGNVTKSDTGSSLSVTEDTDFSKAVIRGFVKETIFGRVLRFTAPYQRVEFREPAAIAPTGVRGLTNGVVYVPEGGLITLEYPNYTSFTSALGVVSHEADKWLLQLTPDEYEQNPLLTAVDEHGFSVEGSAKTSLITSVQVYSTAALVLSEKNRIFERNGEFAVNVEDGFRVEGGTDYTVLLDNNEVAVASTPDGFKLNSSPDAAKHTLKVVRKAGDQVVTESNELSFRFAYVPETERIEGTIADAKCTGVFCSSLGNLTLNTPDSWWNRITRIEGLPLYGTAGSAGTFAPSWGDLQSSKKIEAFHLKRVTPVTIHFVTGDSIRTNLELPAEYKFHPVFNSLSEICDNNSLKSACAELRVKLDELRPKGRVFLGTDEIGFAPLTLPTPLDQLFTTGLTPSRVEGLPEGDHEVTRYLVNRVGTKIPIDTYEINIDRSQPMLESVDFVHKTPGTEIEVSREINKDFGIYVDSSTTQQMIVRASDKAGNLTGVQVSFGKEDSHRTFDRTASGEWAFNVPKGFKGYVTIILDGYASDHKPYFTNGVVAQTSEVTTVVNVDKSIPVVGDLYKNSVTFQGKVVDTYAGLSNLRWGWGDIELGSGLKDAEKLNGQIISAAFSHTFNGETPPSKFWVEATNNFGTVTRKEWNFSIDATSPVVSISNAFPAGLTNKPYSGVVTVTDNNLDVSGLRTEGFVAHWACEGKTCSTPVVFDGDGTHSIKVWGVDKVGFSSNVVEGAFTLDRTPPRISLDWVSPGLRGEGNFYRSARIARVTVTDAHFSPESSRVSGDGVLGAWSHSGDTWAATVSWHGDGKHSFTFTASDQAGNPGGTVSVPEFELDTNPPRIGITGVSDGARYYKDLPSFGLSLSDAHINKTSVVATLTDRRSKVINIPVTWNGDVPTFRLPKLKDLERYVLRVSASDMAGNTVVAQSRFLVNIKGSDFKESDSFNGKYINKPESVILEESSVEPITKVRYIVTLDGTPVAPDMKETNRVERQVDGLYYYTYTLKPSIFKKDGKYTVRIETESDGGKKNQSLLEYSFILDTQKPEVVLSDDLKDGAVFRSANVPVKFIVRDRNLSGVTLDGADGLEDLDDGYYTFTLKSSSDPYSLVISAKDKADNETRVEINDVYVSPYSMVWYWLIPLSLAILGVFIWLLIRYRSNSEEEG